MDLSRARDLAIQLMTEHGLMAKGYRFEFDRSKTRFGVCNPFEKVIKLSTYLVALNSEDEVRDTILHEIAHDLCPKVKGVRGWHGPEWKATAARIGARPERCYDKTVVQPQYKRRQYDRERFKAVCKTCTRQFKRSRTPVKPLACSKCCGGKFNLQHALTWTDGKTGKTGVTLPRSK